MSAESRWHSLTAGPLRQAVFARLGGAGRTDRSSSDTRFFRATTATTVSYFAPVVPCGPVRVAILTVRQPPERPRKVDGPGSTLSGNREGSVWSEPVRR